MQEIVASVKRVTDIMGEISGGLGRAVQRDRAGHRAVSQMDEVTQQNAALVEEAAAAAGSLQEQAQRLAEAVSVFKINTGEVIEVPAHQLSGYAGAPGRAVLTRAPGRRGRVAAVRAIRPPGRESGDPPRPSAAPDRLFTGSGRAGGPHVRDV
ncbi:methyl-accepting chemotaxis protein [Bordetella pertussis]|nr:methyl-accepting chemotaxis protein [Bordetella pertussis]